MDGLRAYGWHNGYRLDTADGINLEFSRVFVETLNRTRLAMRLAILVRQLQIEARTICDGVPVIWHPKIDAKMAQKITTTKIVAISARNVQDALAQWNRAKTRIVRELRQKQSGGNSHEQACKQNINAFKELPGVSSARMDRL